MYSDPQYDAAQERRDLVRDLSAREVPDRIHQAMSRWVSKARRTRGSEAARQRGTSERWSQIFSIAMQFKLVYCNNSAKLTSVVFITV
jgi:hypothetical protein